MNNSTDTTCSGTFYDSGGISGNYGTNENYVKTFVSDNLNRIELVFNMFSLGSYDYLEIYDGPSTSYPKIGRYRGSNSPGSVKSSGRSLTFKFYSNYSTYNVGPGWEAQISCAGPVLPVITMDNQTDTIQEVMFYDHEGPESNYAPYADYTHTFYADTAQYVKAGFNQQGFGLSDNDTLWIYDGADVNAPLLGVYVSGSKVETRTSSGGAMTFRFTSGHSGQSAGWQAHLTETDTPGSNLINYNMSPGERFVCSGIFRDHNGTSNYGVDQNMTQTYTSYNGHRIQFDFNSFSLGSYDYLEIYDGPSTSYPKIGRYRGSNSPGPVKSSGRSLTFKFYSNYSTYNVGPGWEAQISCAGPVLPVITMDNQTDTIQEVMFYDHNGEAENYSNYEDYMHTFYADTADYIKVEWNDLHNSMSNGDTLWIYDGATTQDQLMGVFVKGSLFENFTSSSNALTFRFHSDHTDVARGWQAFLGQTNQPGLPVEYKMSSGIRYTCDGLFRNHNGTGDYSNDEDFTQTFVARDGQRLQVNFNSFHTHHSYDYLKIYDGLSTSGNLQGTYYGSNNPGTITASDSALTFKFHSNYIYTSSGWEAQFSCININPPVITAQPQPQLVCEYDSAVFTVEASGGDTLSYQWKKDGNVLTNETDSTLVIPYVQSPDAANYYCVVSNPYGSDSSQSVELLLNPLPQPSLSVSPVCASASSYTLSGGSPAGGTYSGAFVNNGEFDVSSSGAGDFEIVYTYVDANGCTASATDSLKVLPLASVNFSSLPSQCETDVAFPLTQATPSGGTYSGPGVSGNSFDPVSAGAGNHIVSYTYTDSNGCVTTETQNIVVHANPVVTLNDFPDFCTSGSSFPLSGGTPSGGTYTGTGVTNNVFDPSAAGAGSHPVVYTYTDGNGCQGQAVKFIQVYSKPNVSLSLPSDVCIEQGAVSLNGGTPPGGTYSGTAVINGVFYPSIADTGSHTIEYTYTDTNSCTSSAQQQITVHPEPTVTLNSLPDQCVNGTPLTLTQGTPAGGNYSGNGVTNGVFDPSSAGAGTTTLYYQYTDQHGCSQSDSTTVTVHPLSQVQIDSIPGSCEDGLSIPLNAIPSGGTFSGNGVANGIFDPSSAGDGSHFIQYVFTDSNGCSVTDSSLAVVHALPAVNIFMPDSQLCAYDTLIPVDLMPAGGTLTGPGISAGCFNPKQAGDGLHTIQYYYVDSNGCAAADSLNLTVFDLPVVELGKDTSIALSATLPLDAGSGFYNYLWYNGAADPKVIFKADSAGPGDHYAWVNIENSQGCQNADTLIVNVYDDTGWEKSFKEKFSIYPNPFHSTLTIEFEKAGDYQVSLMTVQGRLIKHVRSNNQQQVQVQAKGLASGIYILNVTEGNRSFTIKVIKKK
ncbi:MAG: CUB domain-containing protein [Bacteroidales bacterium]